MKLKLAPLVQEINFLLTNNLIKMTNITKNKDFRNLFNKISNLIDQSRFTLVRQVNNTITQTYWQIGCYIVEHEQQGKERADYGDKLIRDLSEELAQIYGKGFSYRNLNLIRKFYLTFPKLQTVSAQFKNLSWSHFVRLVSVKDDLERNFYAIECSDNNWSVRELDRQINSCLFERLSASKDKNQVKALSQKGQVIENPIDSLKQPYFFDFTGLDENSLYSESDLETAIINNLQNFLLEMGKGFTFVARQKRISSNSNNFYIDLVLYNRLLRCFVLIDLKIGKITHQDLGQMQMYVNYYDRQVKTDDENQAIGLVLCKENDDFVIEYTLPEENKQIFAKEYKLYLPKRKELQKLLRKYI